MEEIPDFWERGEARIRLEIAKEPPLSDRPSAFEKMALPHLDAVFRAAVALCGRTAEAEDLTQATFAKALDKFSAYTPGTHCRAWLLQILRNHWIDQLRRTKTADSLLTRGERLVSDASNAEETVWSDANDLLENFSDDQVIRALQRLPEDQRLTLYLIDVEKLSQEDVAAITATAVGTVKSRTSRARAALKVILAEYARELGFIKG